MTINKVIIVYLALVSSLLFSCGTAQPSTGWTPQPAIHSESK